MVGRARGEAVPLVVIRRLPMYYRFLNELIESGVEKISSNELSKLMGITASQLRQDLSHFGGFGQQGYGYKVRDLQKSIEDILGLGKEYGLVIVGAGKLGCALAGNQAFRTRRFTIHALFDQANGVVGQNVDGIPVLHIDMIGEYLQQQDIRIGVITTPKEVAQAVADRLVRAGVKCIWNFAPIQLRVPPGVLIEHEHLVDRLLTISCRLLLQEERA